MPTSPSDPAAATDEPSDGGPGYYSDPRVSAEGAREHRLSPAEARMIRTAIDDLTELAVLYECRLFFKGRYQRQAMLAAASRRNALSILRRLT
jgi:hypothetical protein